MYPLYLQQRILLNVLWAAAMQWLLNNPQDPSWFHVGRLVQGLGGIPNIEGN